MYFNAQFCIYLHVYIYLPVQKVHVASSKGRAIWKYILIHLESENKHISFITKCFVFLTNFMFKFQRIVYTLRFLD